MAILRIASAKFLLSEFFRNVMVLMESLAGTGHKLIRIRPKAAEKLEFLYKDPWGKLHYYM